MVSTYPTGERSLQLPDPCLRPPPHLREIDPQSAVRLLTCVSCRRSIPKRKGVQLAFIDDPEIGKGWQFWGNRMVAKPEVSVTAEEPLPDAHGQFWSPAKVTMT